MAEILSVDSRAARFAVTLGLAPATGCLPDPAAIPGADVVGPRVAGSSLELPRTPEVSVWPVLEVEFTEPLDPASIGPGSVALVPWRDEGLCELDPVCDEGSCERGRCQADPLSDGDLEGLLRGVLEEGVPCEVTLSGDGRILQVRPQVPLRAFSRYSWVVGGVRDRSGSPLVGDDGLTAWFRRDFVTSHEASGGPRPRLVLPAPGTGGVPRNLALLDTRFERPVAWDPRAILLLESELGDRAELVASEPCAGWWPGYCVRWRAAETLGPGVRWRPVSTTIVDAWGRAAPGVASSEWFATGDTLDETPPAATGLVVESVGRCTRAHWRGEPAQVEIRGCARAWGSDVYVAMEHVGVPTLEVTVVDLAGNSMQRSIVVEEDAWVDPADLVITEVLADPAGDEPEAEFVEVLNRGTQPVQLAGLYLADDPWVEVLAALAAGEEPPGDPLPEVTVAGGEIFLLVASGWAPSERDPAPPPSTRLVRLDGSLATSGLSNSGEPVVLYRADPPRLLSACEFGAGAPLNGASVVRADVGQCDLPGAWGLGPGGASAPGVLP